MKQSFFAAVLFSTVLACVFISCGGDGSKEQSTGDTATAGTPVTPAVNTIITTPETMMIVNFKVADFVKWQAAYESSDSLRRANGIRSYVIGRGLYDSNAVLVAQKAEDVAIAKAYSKSAALKQAMQRSGVKGPATFAFATATWQDTVVISSPIRSRTTFTVKDWATWLKHFEEGSQERLDNGLTVRVVGHDADDDKKIVLVTAIIDSAKASAYWKSDALKKRREAGGVVTEPDRFVFRIVKRY